MAINHYKQAIACDAGFLEAYNNLVSQFSALLLGWPLSWKLNSGFLFHIVINLALLLTREMHSRMPAKLKKPFIAIV